MAPRSNASGRWLALVPVTLALGLWLLLVPRAAVPRDVPLPSLDTRRLLAVERADEELAEHAKRAPLSPETLTVGTHFRTFNELQRSVQSEAELFHAKQALVTSVSQAVQAGKRTEFVTLRAIQVEAFLNEVDRFEASGEESAELVALAGPFVPRVRDAGWIEGHHVLMDRDALRAAYKSIWSESVGVMGDPAFAPSLDEQRALVAFYLSHPHVPAPLRSGGLGSETKSQCEMREAKEAVSMEEWRLEKVKRLAQIDPSYPADFALGILLYRTGKYGRSAEAFRRWISSHPSGAYARRAENYSKAAIMADQDR